MPTSHQKAVAAADTSLRSSGYAQLRNIRCEYDDDAHVLTLHGHVTVFYYKQLSQEIVRTVEGVERVVNLIEVG